MEGRSESQGSTRSSDEPEVPNLTEPEPVEEEFGKVSNQREDSPIGTTEDTVHDKKVMSRPVSGRPEPARPRSAKAESVRSGTARPDSARSSSERADGLTSGRPTSGRPISGRPTSARPTSGRPSSGRSASQRSIAERLTDNLQNLVSPEPENPDELNEADDMFDYPPQSGYLGNAPPPTQAPAMPTGNLVAIENMQPANGDFGSEEGSEQDGLENESDEEEADLVVLDPEHPLMVRFQNALKKQLSAQHQKVALELSELNEALKRKMLEREQIGVELYGIQQELAKNQVQLENSHDQYNTVHHDRSVSEQVLTGIRDKYKSIQTSYNSERKKAAQLQLEVENLALRLHYVNSAKEDVRSDIAVMKRAAEKADTDVIQAEVKKQQQDLFVDRLVEAVDKLREEISITEAQLTAQLEETKAARESLQEATMEIENITMEKKQLYAQWNSSLIGMKRRDEAHAAMVEANEQQMQKIKALETEIEGFKKQIAKEEEQNEKLTLVLNKCEVDIATSKKLLQLCQQKMEALKTEYSTYTRMLHETEEALNRALGEKLQRNNDITSLRKQIEKEYLEKVHLEDDIMEKIRNQLTFDKAAQYTDRMTKRSRGLTKDLEAQIAEVENEIAQDSLSTVSAQARIAMLNTTMEELDVVAQQKNDIITKSENVITKRNAVIERKQQVIDQFNKKLEQMITQAGGMELGPLEITINSLSKSIESTQQDIASLQLMWLREQLELVNMSKAKDQGHDEVNALKKKISILSQKKIRIENCIEKESAETVAIEKNIRNLRNDMLKLNQMLYNENATQEMLERQNLLTENAFVGNLKEAELESIQLQAKLDGLKEEKERLLNSLVESERQIMLWEKKTQLARETRAAVDSDVGQGEIKAMKAEIHRMEVRYAQLLRQQEKMIQEMEKAVSRRDTIVTRGDAQAKIAQRNKGKEQTITKGTFQRQLTELRKKVKQTIQDAQGCDEEIHTLREEQKKMGSVLEEKQIRCRELQSNADSMDGDIERQTDLKNRNMLELVAKQQRTKYLQQAKEKKYKRLIKDDNLLASEFEKQVDQMQALSNTVERLQEDFPHLQPALRKVSIALAGRISAESSGTFLE